MTISDVCKFELKANVDRVEREKGITRHKAIALLADELGLIQDTARKKDQRARKELGQIVPKESKAPVHSPSSDDDWEEPEEYRNPFPDPDPPEPVFKSGRGGKREGSGRKAIRSLQERLDAKGKSLDKAKTKSSAMNSSLHLMLFLPQ